MKSSWDNAMKWQATSGFDTESPGFLTPPFRRSINYGTRHPAQLSPIGKSKLAVDSVDYRPRAPVRCPSTTFSAPSRRAA